MWAGRRLGEPRSKGGDAGSSGIDGYEHRLHACVLRALDSISNPVENIQHLEAIHLIQPTDWTRYLGRRLQK